MALRSRISSRFLVSELATAMSEDWGTSQKFMRYQLAKESFNWRHPLGAKHGKGDPIQLVSLRITDMCNLRCHSCGQWGDNGCLVGESLKRSQNNAKSLLKSTRISSTRLLIKAGLRSGTSGAVNRCFIRASSN